MRLLSFAPFFFALAALGVMSIWTNDATAYEVKEMPLEQKARLADVVVVGRAISEARLKDDGYGKARYVQIETVTSIKGRAPEKFELLVSGAIVELDPDCCRQGALYLLFVQKTGGVFYVSVNGGYGVYEIDGERR